MQALKSRFDGFLKSLRSESTGKNCRNTIRKVTKMIGLSDSDQFIVSSLENKPDSEAKVIDYIMSWRL